MPDPRSEERAALELVAADVVPDGQVADPLSEPPTVRLGLHGFDEVAVVDHLSGLPQVVVASSSTIADAIRTEACRRGGPSTESVGSGELVVCRDLEQERRWPSFARAAVGDHLALRRWVAVPLAVPGEVPIGSVVLASADPGIVTPSELAVLGALADRWSLALTARLSAGREARAVVAIDAVRVVGLAVGVLMASEGLGEPEALQQLKDRSAESGCRLADAAVAMLSERRMSFR